MTFQEVIKMEECDFKIRVFVELSENSKFDSDDVYRTLRTQLVNAVNNILSVHQLRGNIKEGRAIRHIE